MKYYVKIIIISFFLIFNLLYGQTNKNWENEKQKAENLFNEGKYDESIILFREVIMSSNNNDLKRESYFWIAKAYMSANKLKQAEENLEYYLNNFKDDGLNYPEAVYQKGRLLFLQGQYQSAIDQLNLYKKNYPKHILVSNSFYWIGESLYALGQFDDSSYYFTIVITKYPTSLKKEASIYKLRLIEHKKSELVLQNLLKWSQEQYLASLNQFKIKEKTLQEALNKYKQYENNIISNEEKERFNKLISENQELKNRIAEFEKQMEILKTKIPDEEFLNRLKQLELKEKLLKSKEETLRVFEEELKKKEKSLE
ncbi:MAG: tetratricopeptide repeat protein [Spirochaetes bacterium]|nr:tetratricopeptide repeat protein [Spirochaetota bacterium]